MWKKALWPLFLALLPAPAIGMKLEDFQQKMRAHVAGLSGNVTASVQMEVLGKGPVLFSHNGDRPLVPASNAKIISTLAGLEKMGPGYSVETRVLQKGENLILQGGGDPYLVSERLWLLARDVARSGIKKVNSIQVNNSAFSQDYKGLMDFEKSGEPFTAIVSATSFNFNSLEVHVIPDPNSKQPRVEVGPIPHRYASIRNEVRQTSGSGKDISVRPLSTKGDQETFVVSGTIGKNSSSVIEYASVSRPASYIAHAFAALLRKEGITVKQDFGGELFSPPEGREIAKQDSLNLLDLVRLYNTFSNNFMAEEIFQLFGAADEKPSSIIKSRQAISAYLEKRESCHDAKLENGSGLSWNSQISSHCFVSSLQNAYRDFRIFADLLGSLPVGGQTGTLKSRFKRNGPDFEPWKVRAKTGTLWSKQVVTSLVGFTQTASGETVVFSLIENDKRGDPGLLRGLKDWEDKCLEFVQQLQL